ncbi:MAG: helix-hairpin-helix domain-containing protein [Bacteroidales bacterium]|jgi:DNA uptake protein ComE-like DNA-binding protein|nr:helix-hairpin-helix domain-containing protein [Bacteroidales bacterium]
MKEYLFFSKTDRRNIVMLSIIIILLSVFRMLYSNYQSKKEFLKYEKMIVELPLPEQEIKEQVLPRTKELQNIMPSNEHPKQEKVKQVPVKEIPLLVELNSVDSAGLLPLAGIGQVFAGRIIYYRDRLGGFYCKRQLLEIKYFTEEMYDKLKNNITIDTSRINKLAINKLEFKDILRHPYIDYDMTKIIVNNRAKMYFTSIEDFSSRTGIVDTLLIKYIDLDK